MATVLVTGGSGFLGRHLLQELLAQPDAVADVLAAGRSCPEGLTRDRFRVLDDPGLLASSSVHEVLDACRPRLVFHLAGLTPPGEDERLYHTNVRLAENLLRGLIERFPAIAAQLDAVSIAVDGQIYHEAEFVTLNRDSEIHLLPPVSGG